MCWHTLWVCWSYLVKFKDFWFKIFSGNLFYSFIYILLQASSENSEQLLQAYKKQSYRIASTKKGLQEAYKYEELFKGVLQRSEVLFLVWWEKTEENLKLIFPTKNTETCKNEKNNLQKSPEATWKYVGSDAREGMSQPVVQQSSDMFRFLLCFSVHFLLKNEFHILFSPLKYLFNPFHIFFRD